MGKWLFILFNSDHSIIAVYPNGEEVDVGRLYIYTLDTSELKYRYNNFVFIYSGNAERAYAGRIYQGFIELSNVNRIGTIARLIHISRILGMEPLFANE